MSDIIILLVLAFVIGGASIYLYKAKKRGVKCVGCQYSKVCNKNCNKKTPE